MFSLGTIHFIIVIGFAGLMVWAAICDFSTLRIPNRLSVAVALLFVAHVAAAPGAVDWLGGVLIAATAFAVGTTLFHFRVMGGGDVKLMGAIALWAGPHEGLEFVLVVSLVGGALALVALSPFRHVLEYALQAVGGGKTVAGAARGVVPYGIAIAAGGLYVAAALLAG